ncbi:MAG: hypothetical protein IPN70_00905 [Candidatus Moraniibacteriota bacterium]|nr:MAG: hypothetical protein IPN70_00905 [Candidatus Moranbacteria bacterium]
MKNSQPVVLLTVTKEMQAKCPFPEEMNCLECLSRACNSDSTEDGDMSWMTEMANEIDEERDKAQ